MSHLVLVPLDGSKFSESVLPAALTIARRWNAQLEIVTVQEDQSMLAHDVLQLPSQGWFRRYIEEVAERIQGEAGLTVRPTVLKGSPAEATHTHAAERGVDLVSADELLAVSDYISLHLSLTPETRHLLGRHAFAKMKLA